MKLTDPGTLERSPVTGDSVPLVSVESVGRVAPRQVGHVAITGDLRDDRGGRDREASAISSNQRALRKVGRTQPEGIDEKQIGGDRQSTHRSNHRELIRSGHPEQIDLRGRHGAGRRGDGTFEDSVGQLFPPTRRKELRVGHAIEWRRDAVSGIRQDNRGRDERPGPGTSTGFVDTGDPAESGIVGRDLFVGVGEAIYSRWGATTCSHGSPARRLA
jgi:hypothetical protein